MATMGLAACAGEAPPAQAGSPELDSARAMLTRVSPAMAAEAFARLDQVAHTAEVRITEGGEASTVRRLTREPGDTASAAIVFDPVSRMVPETPPHLAPRTRDRYRLRLLPEAVRGGRRLAGAEAVLLDPADVEPVRRVRSWIDADTGEPVAVEVWRRSDSAIFDEVGRAGVVLSRHAGALYPAAAASDTRVYVPFGDPHQVHVDMTIVDVDP